MSKNVEVKAHDRTGAIIGRSSDGKQVVIAQFSHKNLYEENAKSEEKASIATFNYFKVKANVNQFSVEKFIRKNFKYLDEEQVQTILSEVTTRLAEDGINVY